MLLTTNQWFQTKDLYMSEEILLLKMAINLEQLESLKKDYPQLEFFVDNNVDKWSVLTYVQIFHAKNYIGIVKEPWYAEIMHTPKAEFVLAEEVVGLSPDQYKNLVERIMECYEKDKTT